MNKKILHRKFNSGLRKIFVGINKGYTKVAVGLTKALGYDRLNEDLLKAACQSYEKTSDYYAAYKIRPKTVDKMFLIEEENDIDAQIGIIMQGPIFTEKHFTLETVKIYKKLFPSAKVFISTWDDQDEQEIQLLSKEPNCEIVFNKKPIEPGAVNANMQRETTLGGIRKAKEEGYKYILKTRGDWRIYAKGSLRFMVHLLEKFPCNRTLFDQNKRIIAADIATEETSIMFYPYWVTDLLMFGEINDMEDYWNSDLMGKSEFNKKTTDDTIRGQNYSWSRRIEEQLLNETRIPMNYIKRKMNAMPEISVKGYWDFLRDYCIIVPKSLLDAFWFKYTDRRANESIDWGTCFPMDGEEKLLTYNFDFVSWMNLYNNDLAYKEEFEKIPRERHYEHY